MVEIPAEPQPPSEKVRWFHDKLVFISDTFLPVNFSWRCSEVTMSLTCTLETRQILQIINNTKIRKWKFCDCVRMQSKRTYTCNHVGIILHAVFMYVILRLLIISENFFSLSFVFLNNIMSFAFSFSWIHRIYFVFSCRLWCEFLGLQPGLRTCVGCSSPFWAMEISLFQVRSLRWCDAYDIRKFMPCVQLINCIHPSVYLNVRILLEFYVVRNRACSF